MKYKPCKSCSTLVLMFILLLISVPVPSNGDANDQSKINVKSSTLPGNEENALNEARVKLEEAFTSYRLGDTEVTKQYLDAATKRLKIAAQTSQSEKVTEEASNLEIEKDPFKEDLKERLKENEEQLKQDEKILIVRNHWHTIEVTALTRTILNAKFTQKR